MNRFWLWFNFGNNLPWWADPNITKEEFDGIVENLHLTFPKLQQIEVEEQPNGE